jgi:membrane-bound lytic murein transglycosylase A
MPLIALPPPPAPPTAVQALRLVPPSSVPAFEDDLDQPGAIEAARRTAAWWRAQAPEASIEAAGRRFTPEKLAASLDRWAELLASVRSPAALRERALSEFEVVQSVDPSQGRVSAYFDPELPVTRERQADGVPILSRPPELVDGKPYFSRAEIDAGALDGRGLELFWTRHPADLAILQTEGSGWGRLPDGSRVRLAYNGANGLPFKGIVTSLIERGLLPAGTPPEEALRWLKSRPPEEEKRLVQADARYCFFRIADGTGGPWGTGGIELVPGRSIAVDPDAVPIGLPALLLSRRAVADDSGRLLGERDFSRLVFSHDTGSAIRGATRVDLFLGSGPKAEAEAHHQWAFGRLYLLLPR